MSVVSRNIKRLLLYKLSLYRFKELGFEKVYSYSIANATGVSATQVRKDFAEFGIKGNKRGGYSIDTLMRAFERIFGSENKNIIIVGMGNIGKAIAQYSPRFFNKKLHIVAGFDIDPSKQKKIYNLPVYSLKKLPEIINNFDVKTAIIAVPGQMAQKICDILVDKGVRGFLNFSPIILQVPDNVVVNDINLSNELESIIYNIAK
jgi:redox-sensing transcriptional repressor